jgi:hypothetical protein
MVTIGSKSVTQEALHYKELNHMRLEALTKTKKGSINYSP